MKNRRILTVINGSGFMQHMLAGLKMFGSYILVVVIGLFMAGSFVEVFANNPMWFILYCIAFLIMFVLLAYSEMFNLAQRDMRNAKSRNEIVVYKLKGLVIGAIGAFPLFIFTVLYLINNWEQNQVLRLVYRISIGLFMAFEIYFAKDFPAVYVLILFFIPVTCLLGYLAGYNKFYVSKYLSFLFPAPAKKPAKKPGRKQ